jgi:hypothetical protein
MHFTENDGAVTEYEDSVDGVIYVVIDVVAREKLVPIRSQGVYDRIRMGVCKVGMGECDKSVDIAGRHGGVASVLE